MNPDQSITEVEELIAMVQTHKSDRILTLAEIEKADFSTLQWLKARRKAHQSDATWLFMLKQRLFHKAFIVARSPADWVAIAEQGNHSYQQRAFEELAKFEPDSTFIRLLTSSYISDLQVIGRYLTQRAKFV